MNEIIRKSSFAGIEKKRTCSLFFYFKYWNVLLYCGLLLFSSKTSAQNQEISFVSQSMKWESLLQQAQTQNKLVFIYVYDTRSDVCRQVEGEVFGHSSITANHNRHFVNYKVDGTAESSKNLIAAFNITYFPTLLFFDAGGNLLHNTTEALPASVYLGFLEKLMEEQSLLPVVDKRNMNQSATLSSRVIDSPDYNAQPAKSPKPSSTSSSKSKGYTEQEVKKWEADYYSKKISAEGLRKYAYSLQARQRPYHAVVNQYLHREKAKLKDEINRQFLYDFSETVENDAIRFFLADIQHFKISQGSDNINNKIKTAIQRSILTAIEE
ncbi:MAG: thioredoxin family protein, partial [Chitinophagales bacterium]